MELTDKQVKGFKWAFLTALISGVAVFANGLVVKGIDPIVHTTIKNAAVGVLIIGVLLGAQQWQSIRKLSKKQWLYLLAIGLIGGSVAFALFFTGLKQTGAVEGAMIHKTLVFWIALLAIPLLGERVSRKMVAGIALLYFSNFFVGFRGFSSLGIYHLMILGATMLWAVENIIAKVALKDLHPNVVVAGRMVIGSVVLMGIMLITGKGPLVSQLTGQQWLMLMGVALLLFGYVMSWYRALKLAPATQVASILVGATVITNLLRTVFVTQEISVNMLAQSVSIVAGIFLVVMAGMDVGKDSSQKPVVSS